MVRRIPHLEGIDHNQPITEEEHEEFLQHLKGAVLLVFLERGRLSTMQYRHALERLNQDHQKRAGKKQPGQ